MTILAPWLLLATSLLPWHTVPGEEKLLGVPQEQCCFRKTVGDLTYTLVRINKVRNKSCISRCIYKQDNDKKKLFCFSKGKLTSKCLQSTNHNEVSNTDSDTSSTSESISTLIDGLKAANKVKTSAETKILELKSTTSAATKITFYLNELKTILDISLQSNGPESTISCVKISTNLSEVRLMLTYGSDAYNITKALEVTQSMNKFKVSEFSCSEEEINSIYSEVKATEECLSLVLLRLTASANSLSEALAQLCPACNNQPSSPSLISQSSPSPSTSVSTPAVPDVNQAGLGTDTK